ncbi:MAG: hypothetical protein IMW97_03095 [Firmicutes bacterium]|nr:hypothetical protein [Candidatus Fermentithermobacillaceae bacterium]
MAGAQTYQRLYISKPDGTRLFIFTTPGRPGFDLLLEGFLRGWRRVEARPGITIPKPGTPVSPPLPDEGSPVAPLPETGSPIMSPPATPPVESRPAQPRVPTEEGRLPGVQDGRRLAPEEAEMLELVNAERTKRGLKPLTVDFRLVELARKKSQDMIDKNYFGHYSPTYGSPFDMMKSAGIEYRLAGENLAGAPDAATAHKALMNSEGHRRNILNPGFTKIGIGAAKGGPYGIVFTQMFIGD